MAVREPAGYPCEQQAVPRCYSPRLHRCAVAVAQILLHTHGTSALVHRPERCGERHRGSFRATLPAWKTSLAGSEPAARDAKRRDRPPSGRGGGRAGSRHRADAAPAGVGPVAAGCVRRPHRTADVGSARLGRCPSHFAPSALADESALLACDPRPSQSDCDAPIAIAINRHRHVRPRPGYRLRWLSTFDEAVAGSGESAADARRGCCAPSGVAQEQPARRNPGPGRSRAGAAHDSAPHLRCPGPASEADSPGVDRRRVGRPGPQVSWSVP